MCLLCISSGVYRAQLAFQLERLASQHYPNKIVTQNQQET